MPITSLQRHENPELRDHAHMSLVGYQTHVINGHIDFLKPAPSVTSLGGS